MSALTIYLWTRMNSINGLVLFMTAMCFLYCVFRLIRAGVEADAYRVDKEVYDRHISAAKKGLVPTVIGSLLFALTPTQKDLAMMYVLPSMVNSETFAIVKKETPEIAQIALDALKDVLRDSADNKKEHQKGN